MAKSLFGSVISAASNAVKAAEREKMRIQKQEERLRAEQLRKELKHQAEVQGFIVALPRIKQIIEESIALIQESNNLSVITRRYDDMIKHYNWVMDQKRKGMPVYFEEEPCGFESSIRRAFNENIERAIDFIYIKDIQSIIKTKNTESKAKRISKLRDSISFAISNLKTHENKGVIAENIREYRNKLKEDIKI